MPSMVSWVPTRPFSTGNVYIDFIFEQMIDAEQIPPHADRPGDRRTLNFQNAFDFIEQTRSVPGRPDPVWLTKVMMGVSRSRHTSMSLIVRFFDALGAVETIKAESTAVSVR